MTTPPDAFDRLQLADVARHLGVTKQRVHQLSAERGFPRPDTRVDGVRWWDRGTIEDWAEREWWGTRPWRTSPPPDRRTH